MAALEAEHDVDVPTLARKIIADNSELVKEAGQGMILDSLKNYLTRLGRSITDRMQMEFFGFPPVIAVPVGEGYRWMLREKASWNELVAGKEIRDENIRRANAKADAYQEALETVRPIMEGTNLTFAEAFLIIKGKSLVTAGTAEKQKGLE